MLIIERNTFMDNTDVDTACANKANQLLMEIQSHVEFEVLSVFNWPAMQPFSGFHKQLSSLTYSFFK